MSYNQFIRMVLLTITLIVLFFTVSLVTSSKVDANEKDVPPIVMLFSPQMNCFDIPDYLEYLEQNQYEVMVTGKGVVKATDQKFINVYMIIAIQRETMNYVTMFMGNDAICVAVAGTFDPDENERKTPKENILHE